MWMENRDRGRKQREKERECGKAVEFARPERKAARNALKWNAMAMRRYLSASPGAARVCICWCVCVGVACGNLTGGSLSLCNVNETQTIKIIREAISIY